MAKTPGQCFYKDVAFCRRLWYAVCGATNNGRRLALSRRGQLLLPPAGEGGCPMVTYSDLIQLGILIVGIIGLFMQAKKK